MAIHLLGLIGVMHVEGAMRTWRLMPFPVSASREVAVSGAMGSIDVSLIVAVSLFINSDTL